MIQEVNLYFCREEQDRVLAKWLQDLTNYENNHMGNFRRIYPVEGCEKYEKFFHSSGSLYQETAAFKARSECARQVANIVLLKTFCAKLFSFIVA